MNNIPEELDLDNKLFIFSGVGIEFVLFQLLQDTLNILDIILPTDAIDKNIIQKNDYKDIHKSS